MDHLKCQSLLIFYRRSEIGRTHLHISQHVQLRWYSISHLILQIDISDFLSNYFIIIADTHYFFIFWGQCASGHQRAIIQNSKGFPKEHTATPLLITDEINSKSNICGKEPRRGVLCMVCKINLCLTLLLVCWEGLGRGKTGKYITDCSNDCSRLSQCACAAVVKKTTSV